MKILFQGDSITDAGRDRSDSHNLTGYNQLVAEKLSKNFNDLEFINLGISGDSTKMLLDRMDNDIIAIQPDIITILIGINDLWRRFDSNLYTSPAEIENNYREILTRIKNETNAKIVILEPFILPLQIRMHFRLDLYPIIELTRKLAMEFADAYIPIDGCFAKACIKNAPETFSLDGVHPSLEGHKIIAENLYPELEKLINLK